MSDSSQDGAIIVGGSLHGQTASVDQDRFSNGQDHYALHPVTHEAGNMWFVWKLETLLIDEANSLAVLVAARLDQESTNETK